jgi:uncharacterized protein (DUF2126 family)
MVTAAAQSSLAIAVVCHDMLRCSAQLTACSSAFRVIRERLRSPICSRCVPPAWPRTLLPALGRRPWVCEGDFGAIPGLARYVESASCRFEVSDHFPLRNRGETACEQRLLPQNTRHTQIQSALIAFHRSQTPVKHTGKSTFHDTTQTHRRHTRLI